MLFALLGACVTTPLETQTSMAPQASDLRAVYGSDGVWVEQGSRDLAPVRLSLRSWGREAALEAVGSAVPAAGECLSWCERRVDYSRRGLVEWWEERDGELEQGFDIVSPPAGDGFLVLDLLVDGADVAIEDSGTAATFARPGAPSLYYKGLAAWDETGRTLPAWMEGADQGLRLVVDDRAARGSVTVDPLLTAVWTTEVDQGGAHYGNSVSDAGDVNGDGFGDVIVGAHRFDNGELGEGRAFLFLGSASGLETTEAWTTESDQVEAKLGESVSTAGDVNGDGFADVIVGAEEYDNGSTDEGRVYVFLGSAAGLETLASWTAESDQDDSDYGDFVSSAGDVNGDGYDDVVVGAKEYDGGSTDEGKAFLYVGSAYGLDTIAAWTAEPDQDGAHLASAVSSAGDVNGDGYDDVVVGVEEYDNGSTDEGRALLFLGSTSGLETTESWAAEQDQDFFFFGGAVSSAGDVNGDGFDDVVVGGLEPSPHDYVPPIPVAVWEELANDGTAHLYLGSASGLETIAAWMAESSQDDTGYGHVSSAGDVNGDGYGDLVVGAPFYDNGSTDEGRAFLYLGSASGLGATAAWTRESNQDGAAYGGAVSSAGDVNADGYDDVVVAAAFHDNGRIDEGKVHLYLGGMIDPDLDGVPAESDICPSVADPGQEDVNGDGVGDACVPLALVVQAVSVVGGLTLDVSDALPGESVVLLLVRGPPKDGACPADRALCLDVGARAWSWKRTADANGRATVNAMVPPMLVEGSVVTFQVVAFRGAGGVKSDPIETTVGP